MRRLARIALCAVTLLAVGPGCGENIEAPAVTAPPVLVGRVEARSVTDRIQSTGQLLAVEEASVATEVGGRVTRTLVQEGAAVDAGDTVLEVDRERRQLELASQRALVSESRARIAREGREARRLQNLRRQNATSQALLDEAETNLLAATSRLAAAEARLGLAERALRDAEVKAPFSGLIARRYVSVGDFVGVGEKLFDLIALDPVEVEFHLTERDSGRVEIGDRVSVRVAPYPDEVFEARVTMISPRIDVRTRTLRVKALLDNADGRLRPGLFARADLGVAQREDVPMIPEEAVLQRSDGSVVFVLTGDDHVARRRIKLGVFRDGWVEVADGVAVGEYVVVRGHARLIDGSVVDLRQSDGAPVARVETGSEMLE